MIGSNRVRILQNTSNINENQHGKWYGMGNIDGLGIDYVNEPELSTTINDITDLSVINNFLEEPGFGLESIHDYIIGGGDDIYIVDKTNKKVWYYTWYNYPDTNVNVKDLFNASGRTEAFVEVEISLIRDGIVSIEDIVSIQGRYTLFITTHKTKHPLSKNKWCQVVKNQSTNAFHKRNVIVNTTVPFTNTYPFINYSTNESNYILSRIQIGEYVEYKSFELPPTTSSLTTDLLTNVTLTVEGFDYKQISFTLSNIPSDVDNVRCILSKTGYSDSDIAADTELEQYMSKFMSSTDLVPVVSANGTALISLNHYFQTNIVNFRCVSVHS